MIRLFTVNNINFFPSVGYLVHQDLKLFKDLNLKISGKIDAFFVVVVIFKMLTGNSYQKIHS